MERDVFDRETLLDLTVNVIPLGIILFFVLLFVVVAPWGFSPVETAAQMALLVAPFAALALLTYYSGKAIARDEKQLEADPDVDGELEVGASPELEGDSSDASEDESSDAVEGDSSDAAGDDDEDSVEDDSSDDAPDPATNDAVEE